MQSISPGLLIMLMIVLLCCGVVARDSIPTGPNPSAIKLQAEVKEAIATGQTNFTIDSGKYVFSNTTFLIENGRDFTIEAAPKVELWFYLGFGVQINNCHNVTLRGITVDYDPPNYAQGKVVAVNGSVFEATFEPSFLWPDMSKQPFSQPGGVVGAKVAFWDPNSLRMMQIGNQFMNASSLAGGDGRWVVRLNAPVRGASPGHSLVTIWPRRGLTWNLENSSGVVSEDITLYAGGNMGFHETFGGGNVYRRVRAVRRPGAVPVPLLAMNADGFHSSDATKGPVLVDSEISFTGDDFLNIHNRMMLVCKKSSAHELIVIDVSNGALKDLAAGDTMSFYHLNTLKHLATSSVVSSAQTRDPALLDECRNARDNIAKPPYNTKLIVSIDDVLYKVTFHSLPTEVETFNLANFDRRSGAGAVVSGNHFHDGFSRMALLKAPDTTYTHNVVERAHGIYVESEQLWLEGALNIRNVHVADNTIVDDLLGHITVMAGLQNITCRQNVFVEHGKNTTRNTC